MNQKLQTNPRLELADQYVRFTNTNIFLTGKAGTGKTTFLKNIKTHSPKRMVIVAPTGVAAINAGGVTIHSFFQLSFGPNIPNQNFDNKPLIRKFSNEKIKSIKAVDILVIDEAQLYVDDDGDDILSILSTEARKFGIGILAASQTASFPDSFISSLATKVILGIDEMYWKTSVAKMRIDEKLLGWVKPKRTLAVQMKESSATKTEWKWVVMPDSTTNSQRQTTNP